MQLQILKDEEGKKSGVYIPIKDWETITKNYPDIEHCDEDIPQWHKDILDERLKDLNNPAELISLESFLEELEKDI